MADITRIQKGSENGKLHRFGVSTLSRSSGIDRRSALHSVQAGPRRVIPQSRCQYTQNRRVSARAGRRVDCIAIADLRSYVGVTLQLVRRFQASGLLTQCKTFHYSKYRFWHDFVVRGWHKLSFVVQHFSELGKTQ